MRAMRGASGSMRPRPIGRRPTGARRRGVWRPFGAWSGRKPMLSNAHAAELLALLASEVRYLALLVDAIDRTATGAALPEPGYGGYERVPVEPSDWAPAADSRM